MHEAQSPDLTLEKSKVIDFFTLLTLRLMIKIKEIQVTEKINESITCKSKLIDDIKVIIYERHFPELNHFHKFKKENSNTKFKSSLHRFNRLNSKF